jgi:hypothetical protein
MEDLQRGIREPGPNCGETLSTGWGPVKEQSARVKSASDAHPPHWNEIKSWTLNRRLPAWQLDALRGVFNATG